MKLLISSPKSRQIQKNLLMDSQKAILDIKKPMKMTMRELYVAADNMFYSKHISSYLNIPIWPLDRWNYRLNSPWTMTPELKACISDLGKEEIVTMTLIEAEF